MRRDVIVKSSASLRLGNVFQTFPTDYIHVVVCDRPWKLAEHSRHSALMAASWSAWYSLISGSIT